MNRGKPPKSSCERDSGLDRLSNLPSHIIDLILIHMPVRDAVRTSLLSSQWRFKWTTMPALVFDENCFSLTPQDQTINQNELVSLVDNALFLHNDQISKFMLYQRYPISSTDLDGWIDRWILRLLRCHVEEFKLVLQMGQRYKLHSCLFSFQNLVHLELYRCHLKLPSTFGGFKKLKSLDLLGVTMAQDVLETLIFGCPILESLTLDNVGGFTQLNIDAPNLLNIYFMGYFDDINFINTSNLAAATIELVIADDSTERTKPRDSSNLLKFLSSLPCIRRLGIGVSFLEYLAIGGMPGQLSNPCPDLDYLYLDFYINDSAECSAALCLLRSCPNIQELEITVNLSMEEAEEFFTFWESVHENDSFNKLRTVNIYGIFGNRHVLEFIRFMLVASPMLQKMTIEPSLESSESEALQLAKELLTFERASAKAKVVLLELV